MTTLQIALLLAIISMLLVNTTSGFMPRQGRMPVAINQMVAKSKIPKAAEPVAIPSSYNVAGGFLATAATAGFGFDNWWAGVPIGLIGLLLLVQTGRVRFVFDKEAMEVFVERKNEKGEVEQGSRENFVVGGKNRWKYSTFTDWFFIPSKDFPILMYFKENQTSPEGQVHLFPVIMDGKMLYETLMEKVGSVSSSSPSKKK
jgi:Protein of unknown function (DUF3119)